VGMIKRPALGVYIVAGWPNAEVYREAVACLSGLVDFFELGVPTKNPKYDGPYIRVAHREVAAPVWDKPAAPTYLMAYWEDYAARPAELFKLAAEVGARGVLAPDLLVDYPGDLEQYLALSREFGLAPVFFLPSKFPHSLAKRIAAAGPDFIYLGLYAATGIELPVYVERNISIVKKLAPEVPLVAGFAIDRPEKAVKAVKAGADGVVVGTAFMRRLKTSVEEGLRFLWEIKQALVGLQ